MKKTKISNAVAQPAESTEQTEVPYKLPEGWKWELMSSVVTWGSGGTPKATEPKYYENGTIPWLIISDLNDGVVLSSQSKITQAGLDNSSAKIIPKNTLLVAMYGSIGKLGIAGIECCTNQAIAFAKELNGVITKYLFFYMASIKNKLIAMGRGGTQQNISQTLLNTLQIPLPSTIEEQWRIVKRIESLFAKLDAAKEKARNVLDSFETRKAAILHKAFSGELTASWRKRNNVADDSWEEKTFDSCVKKMQNGLSKRSGEKGKGTVVLRLANLGETNFDVSDLRTIKLTEKERENYILYKNDVAMIRVNGSKSNVARQILVASNDSWSFCDHIIRIVYESFCLPNYMVYFSGAKKYKDYVFENMVSSAGQNTISRKGLANLKIPIPTLAEQQEIVRILDNILQKEQKAKQAAQTVLEQIDLLKKSILARAFRGEM